MASKLTLISGYFSLNIGKYCCLKTVSTMSVLCVNTVISPLIVCSAGAGSSFFTSVAGAGVSFAGSTALLLLVEQAAIVIAKTTAKTINKIFFMLLPLK